MGLSANHVSTFDRAGLFMGQTSFVWQLRPQTAPQPQSGRPARRQSKRACCRTTTARWRPRSADGRRRPAGTPQGRPGRRKRRKGVRRYSLIGIAGRAGPGGVGNRWRRSLQHRHHGSINGLRLVIRVEFESGAPARVGARDPGVFVGEAPSLDSGTTRKLQARATMSP